MKNVWVLERFIDAEEMKATLARVEELLAVAETEEQVKVVTESIDAYKKRIAENPEGHWLGYEGKCDYKEFCYVAKEFLRRNNFPNAKLRVVKAQVADDSKYWTNYKNPVENEKVLRYLYATYRQ